MDAFCEARPMYQDPQKKTRITNAEIYRSDHNLELHTDFMLQLYAFSSSKVVFIYGALGRKCFKTHLNLSISDRASIPEMVRLEDGRTLVFLPHPECIFRWAKRETRESIAKVLTELKGIFPDLEINVEKIQDLLSTHSRAVEKEFKILDDNEEQYIEDTPENRNTLAALVNYKFSGPMKLAHGEEVQQLKRKQIENNGTVEDLENDLDQLRERSKKEAHKRFNERRKATGGYVDDAQREKQREHFRKIDAFVAAHQDKGMTNELAFWHYENSTSDKALIVMNNSLIAQAYGVRGGTISRWDLTGKKTREEMEQYTIDWMQEMMDDGEGIYF